MRSRCETGIEKPELKSFQLIQALLDENVEGSRVPGSAIVGTFKVLPPIIQKKLQKLADYAKRLIQNVNNSITNSLQH